VLTKVCFLSVNAKSCLTATGHAKSLVRSFARHDG